MRKESRQAVRAVFLAAIMIVSVFAAGIAFSGSAAAEVTEISGVSAENTTAGDANQIENVTLEGVDKTSSGTSDLTATIEGADVSIKSAGLVDSGNFNASNVTVSERNAGGLFVLITGNDTPSGDITIEVTLNTTNADPGTEGTYSVTSVGGASASGDFQIQSDNDGSQSDGVLTVDPDGGTDAYDTIQAAVNNAKSGDTVEVTSGTYEESVTISTEGLTLENAESAEPTVIGQSSVAISVESPSVTISDLTIRNPEGDRGVRATDNATNVKIARNTIEDVGTAGAFTQSRGILVSSLKNGDSASGLEVRNNTVNTIQGTGGNSEQTIGIQILEESNGGGLIENVVVDGNVVTNLLDNRSSQGINFNGNIEGEITNNNISTLNTDRPGEDLGFTQAIALNAGGNAANAPQNVRISGNSISGLDDQTPSTESYRATHIILSSVDDTDSIDIRNNVFIAAASDENYILDRASGDFDLQGALGVNTFEPSVVQVEEGSDRVLVPDTGADVDVVNVDQQTGFDQIQSAVDAANPGDTIEIEAGTYNEKVTIDKPLTIVGAGNSASGTVLNASSSGSNGITVNASDVTVRNLRITDYSNGIRLKNTHSNIIFENVDSVGNSNRGMEIRNSADLDDLELNNVNFSNNERGIRGATTSSIDGLTITDSSLNNNTQAIYFAQEDSDDPSGRLTDVFISDTEIIDSEQKGIYTTKLSDATFDNITIDGITSDTYGYNNGIDINLKYDDYSNITIRDSTVANVSKGDPGTPSASAAVAVKARGSTSDDSSYTSNPATLDDVTIDNVTIEDSFNGLRVGEFGTDYSSGGGPTSVTVTDSTFQNNSGYHIRDLPSSLDLSDALNNQANDFDRVVTIEDDAGNITGNSIFGAIQPAIDNAEPGQVVEADPGTYDESVDISTKNVTLLGPNAGTPGDASRGDEAVIEQGLKINASEVTVDGLQIENNGTNGVRIGPEIVPDDIIIQHNRITNVEGGSFLRGGADTGAGNGIQIQFGVPEPNGETAQNIRIVDNEISDISTRDVGEIEGESGGTLAIGINVLPRGNDISGLEVENNTIRSIEPGVPGEGSETETRAISVDTQLDDPGRGSASLNAAGQVSGLRVTNNTFTDLTAGDGVAAITLFEDGRVSPRTGVENFEIRDNEFSRFDANDEVAVFIGGYEDLGRHDISLNNFSDGNIIRFDGDQSGYDVSEADALDARLNFYNGRLSNDSINITGIGKNSRGSDAVLYDPVLTVDPSERVDNVEDIRNYGSYIELETEGEPVAIGFPARPDRDLGEILPDDIGSGVSIFVYDNTAPADQNGFDQPGGDIGNYTPEAGEVIIITGSPISAEFVIPIDNAVEGNAGLPAQTEVREGWNLVATGAAGDISTIDSTSDIVLSTQIQTQPTQPGAPPVPGDSPIGAYEGTWLFVSEDGFIAPGYAPGQPPSVYTEFVLATEAEDNVN